MPRPEAVIQFANTLLSPKHHLCQRYCVWERYRGPPRPPGVLITRLPNPVPVATLGPGGINSLRLLSCPRMTVKRTRFVLSWLLGLDGDRGTERPQIKILPKLSFQICLENDQMLLHEPGSHPLWPPKPSQRHRAWFVRSLPASRQKAPQSQGLADSGGDSTDNEHAVGRRGVGAPSFGARGHSPKYCTGRRTGGRACPVHWTHSRGHEQTSAASKGHRPRVQRRGRKTDRLCAWAQSQPARTCGARRHSDRGALRGRLG